MTTNSEMTPAKKRSTIKFVLRDMLKDPLTNLPYEIKDENGNMVLSGKTDATGQFVLTHEAGARLFLHLQPLSKGPMKFYREFTMQDRNGSVIWITSFVVVKATLKQNGAPGDYVRGTYVVQKGDRLSEIAERFGMTTEDFLALNKEIINVNYIYVGQVLKLPNQKVRYNPKKTTETTPKPASKAETKTPAPQTKVEKPAPKPEEKKPEDI